ncbi:N-acetylmuramoyl-L-alanine amidase [Pedobacter boryungensis]|uniref:N-acetylmuramoyl-L-alanine amidase n=1 Tax=Pedobacter boryungensis TaxID=869962 RepID=A0ABX2DCX5_9SPHI|nr:N-acetylmuramoyl-L-alanine amidase [Pedobacter boryungensis]NQX31934.1 N-acetylmuramoyl-L-alanine amidase [Pedobacter boryungensis]
MEWFNYLLKVSACTTLFFAFYLLVLRKLTFFKINRFYLLGSLLLSFVIPALQFKIEKEVEQSALIEQTTTLSDVDLAGTSFSTPIVVGSGTGDIEVEPFDWYALLPYVYTAVVMGFLAVAAWRLFQLYKHTRTKAHEINGLKLVAKSAGFTNCSFFNYVFIDQNSLTEAELKVLLQHEEVHARQLHSIDKILLMIAKAVLWFNPIVYLYDKALEQAHEYEADETTSLNFGAEHYAHLLLKLAVSKNTMPLIHNFVKSPIKERIKMLFHSKSKNMKKLMYLLALPIGLGLLWGFTVDVVEVPTKTANEFTLILDAGHGGKEIGANINGYKEKDIALAFTKKIKALAEAKGIKVVTTRADDESLSLADRLKPQGDFLLSIHVNSEPIATGGSKNGIEMYTPTSDNKLNWFKSTSMTYNLYKNLTTVEGIKTGNKPFQKKLFLLQNSNAAGLVLEMGYLTNKQDLKTITNEAKQDELATAIVNAILQYKTYLKTDQEIERNLKGGTLPEPPKPNQQNVPLIKKTSMNYKDGKTGEKIVITANGKTFPIIYTSLAGQTKVYFYINQKVYSEAEAMQFTPAFIAKLSDKSGIGNIKSTYEVPGVENTMDNYVVWFGVEPKLSAYAVKNKDIYEKYNGKTVDGKVIDYTYSPVSKVMDGFIVKTTTGETLKANVEEKFAKQTQAMVTKGDKVSIKIYNANYNENIAFPVVFSYKLMKGDKVLFDRWPKTASTLVNDATVNVVQNEQGKIYPKPMVYKALSITNDTKNNISYLKKGIMEIGENKLEGEEIAFDKRKETITAKNGKLTLKGGTEVAEKYIIYDIKKGTYITNKTPGNTIQVNSDAYELISRLKANNDSLKMNTIMNKTLIVSGNVKLNIDKFLFNAKVFTVDKNSDVIVAHVATLTTPEGYQISGDKIEYNTLLKKYTVTQPVGSVY